MKRKTTKTKITISIDSQLDKIIEDLFKNKSEYVEWLIYQNLSNTNLEDVKKIII